MQGLQEPSSLVEELTDEEDPCQDVDLGAALVNGLSGRMNLSVRVQNDIDRAESKGNRKPHNSGRDDRATSEQVLDPRTSDMTLELGNHLILLPI